MKDELKLLYEYDPKHNHEIHAWPDPRFLERGFILYKGVGVPFADFISLFLISHENVKEFGISFTQDI